MAQYSDPVSSFKAWALALLLAVAGCSQADPDSSSTTPTEDTGATSPTPAASLPEIETAGPVAFMEEATRAILERDPEWMTDLGLADRHDQLTPIDDAYAAGTVQLARDALSELDSVDYELDAATEIAVDIFRWWLEDIVSGQGFRLYDYPVSFITGAHVNLPEFLVDIHPLTSQEDAEDYLARLGELADKVDGIRQLVIEAEAAGILMPATTRGIVRSQLALSLREPAGLEALVTEFARRISDVPAIDPSLVEDAAQVVDDEVIPAYQLLRDTIDHVQVRSTAGVWDLPDGDAYYRWTLRHHTTSNLSPEDMHEWGLTEVERVRNDMAETLAGLGYNTSDLNRAIGQGISDAGTVSLGGSGDRQAFLDENKGLVDEAYVAFADMFSVLPTADVIIQRPAPSREGGSGAYYRGPDLAGDRPGIYYLSMGSSSRPAHNFATTTYHEAVPGHHFQLALQAESANPLHQRAVVFSGYAEGWALYAERLAFEAGLYDDDPFGNIGRLQLELLRAARVVTDTGIHAMRWTRDEAIRYHMDATALPEQFSTREVERYIVWPGQAPGYLLGMNAILEARSAAEAALGADFDIAAFHDVVLGHGSLPLPVLRSAVDAWVAGAGG